MAEERLVDALRSKPGNEISLKFLTRQSTGAGWRDANISLVAISVFLLATGHQLAKVGRDALFVQERGLWDLPTAYMGIALFAGPLAALALTSMRLAGPRVARILLSLLASGLLLLFAEWIRPGGGLLMTGFFVFVALIWGILYSMAWLLAGDVLEGRSQQGRAKAYGVIASFAITGGLVGGVLARLLANSVAPAGMVRIAALAVAVATLLLAGVRIRQSGGADCPESGSIRTSADPEAPLKTVLGRLLRSRYGYLLLGVGMSAGLVGELLEFQFYLAAADSGGSIADDASHFARIYAALNGGALVLQVLLVPRLQGRIGVGGGLLVLPAILAGASGAMVAGVSAWGVSALRAVEGGLKSSIHRPNWEQAYLALSRAERSVAKLLVDGIGIRLAEGFGAILLWLWLTRQAAAPQTGTGQATLLTALFLASAIWLALGWHLRKGVIAYAGSRPVREAEDSPVPLPECCHVTAVLGRDIHQHREHAAGSPRPDQLTGDEAVRSDLR